MADREFDPSEYASDEEMRAAADPSVGTGSSATAPWEDPAVGWLRRQPVIAALLASNLPLLIGLVEELADKHTDAGAASLIFVGLVVLNAAFAVVRQAVTPTARPRLDAETPLVPDGA